MKILLIGEFSSFHKYLKKGLERNGHKVTLIANQDGWKKIDGADTFLFKSGGKNHLYHYYLEPFLRMKKFKGYDVVQFMNPLLFSLVNNELIIKRLCKENKIASLVAAGYDYRLYSAWKNDVFDYYMIENSKDALLPFDEHTSRGKRRKKNDLSIENNVDVIIPSLYEYSVGYPKTAKLNPVIPFAIDLDSIEYKENIVKDKIVFFHGLNREIEKGTDLIRLALEKLKENYPDTVDFYMEGHMPFKEYMDVMDKTNVVIDQCKSYGYGINACVAMAKGKVVMSGARKETLDAFGVKETPIFHIEPDVDKIYCQLEKIVKQKNNIKNLGYESRKYVEQLHDCKKVAKQYEIAWRKAAQRKGIDLDE